MPDITCVIPRWGRTFQNIMTKFAALSTNPGEIEQVIRIVAEGKKAATTDPRLAADHLKAAACPFVSVAPDRKRDERHYRIGFMGMDICVRGIVLRLEGDEPHNGSSLIKLDEVDFTIVGLDELLSLNQHYLKAPEKVTKWGLYNYNIDKDTDLRIAGSAHLLTPNQSVGKDIVDFVGFFFISNQGIASDFVEPGKLVKKKIPTYVKGRYEGIVHKLLPGVNTVSVENVEDAVVADPRGVGIEIVQSGGTIKRKGLRVHGSPLFISESLYVADYHRYLKNEKMQELFDILSPLGYFDENRLTDYVLWFKALEKNLGEAWERKPSPDEIFCSLEEVENGLRPYRLQTRRWVPSDTYKIDEAKSLVAGSLEKVRELYRTMVM